ncbi:MAG TPA: flippase [Pantanalinema sp.]
MRNKVTFNTVVQIGSRVLELGSALFVNAWIARHWGSEAFGQIGLYMSLSGVFIFMFDFGLGNLLIRTIAQNRAQARHFVLNGLVALLPFSLLGSAAVIGIGVAITSSRNLGLLVLVALHLVLIAAFLLLRAAFHAYERMELESLSVLFERACWIAAGVWLALRPPSLVAFFTCFTLCKLLNVLVAGGLFIRHIRPHAERAVLRLATQWGLIKQTIPFGLSWAFDCINSSFNLLLLSHLVGGAEVGCYRAAGTLIAPLSFVAASLNSSLLPKMSEAASAQEKTLFCSYSEAANRLILAAGIPLALFIILFAPAIIHTVYGAGFEQAVLLLQLLSLAIPLRFLSQSVATTLLAGDQQARSMRCFGAAAAFNLAGNFVVLPHWGSVGACLVTIATDLLVLILMSHQQGFSLGGKVIELSPALKCLAIACLVLIPLAWAGVPLLAAALIFALLYPLLLIRVKALSAFETRLLWRPASL